MDHAVRLKMIISNYYSQKIRTLNLVLILMVVYIHGEYKEASTFLVANSLQKVCSGTGFSSVANVMFFLLSGFLFFNGVLDCKACVVKIKKRLKTLFVPYVLWNCIFVLWYVLLALLPGVEGFVNSNVVESLLLGDWSHILKYLFWNPANFPLWFLRDLIIMVLLSPLLLYGIKYLKWLAPIPFMFFYEYHHISPFFILGGCVAMHLSLEDVSNKLNAYIMVIASTVYISLSFSQIWLVEYNHYLWMLNGFCGCIVLWKGYDWVVKIRNKAYDMSPIKKFLGYSFFIFVFHEPTFNIIKKIGLRLFGIHEWSLIVLYLANPLIMCLLSIGVAKILQSSLPKVYNVLVGGRK